jgi:hypothetical protein
LLSGYIYAFALLSVVATSDFICTRSACSPESGDKKGNQKILFPQPSPFMPLVILPIAGKTGRGISRRTHLRYDRQCVGKRQ